MAHADFFRKSFASGRSLNSHVTRFGFVVAVSAMGRPAAENDYPGWRTDPNGQLGQRCRRNDEKDSAQTMKQLGWIHKKKYKARVAKKRRALDAKLDEIAARLVARVTEKADEYDRNR
jgi:hypothetical protein